MINNIWFKIIAGKINKIPEFYTIFARKMPDYITDNEIEARGGQNLEAEAEVKILASRPLCPRGLNITANNMWLWDIGELHTVMSVWNRHRGSVKSKNWTVHSVYGLTLLSTSTRWISQK